MSGWEPGPSASREDSGSVVPAVSFPPGAPFSVADRFLSVASRLRGRPALRFPDRPPMSYAALAGRMESVRAVLRHRGVGPERVVAVALEDPAEWVPALLAVLAEGAIYLALDLRLPEARLRDLIADSTAAWVLCASGSEGAVAAWGVTPLEMSGLSDAPASASVTPAVPRSEDSVAFLTYTSGSTGAPKGIALRHANLLHEVSVHAATLGLTPDDRLTGLYPPSTVGCTRDLYAALLCGASVGFFPFRDRGVAALRDWIRQERLTRYHSVPPIFRELVQELGPGEVLPDLRTVYLAGDRVTWNDLDLCRRHTAPHCRFYTGIGTSETSSLYAHGFVDPQEPRDGAILPSGMPVPGVTVRLLGADGFAAAPDEPGEIVVQGRWLAAGYWRRERRAPEPFPEVPGSGGERCHHTGDLATRDPQGRLLFQGRRDQQVKILGNRIDLSEVDLQLRRLPGVREVAVRLMTADDRSLPRLTAFVSWAGEPLPLSEVRRQLLAHLPVPAVPVRFHWLPEFPKLANGKLDARGLDRITTVEPPVTEGPGKEDGRPWTPAQERMAALWQEVLGVPEFGLHDSFFALGGQSLSAMRLLARIRTAFPATVTLRMLFEAPTVAGLLEAMGASGEQGGDVPAAGIGARSPRAGELRPVPRNPPPRASHAQERLWFAEALDPGSTSYVMPDAVRLRGPLDAAALERALRRIVERHESLRTVFSESGGTLRQIVRPVPDTVLESEDLSGVSPAERESRLQAAHQAVLSRPFRLASGSLFRFRLLRLGDAEHVFLRAFHHIIADGWSVEVFHRELTAGYAAALSGVGIAPAALEYQFADVAEWQRRALEGGRMEALIAHWTRQLAGAPPRLELVREEAATDGSSVALNVVRQLPAALSDAVARVSQSLGATPFIVLLAAFQALLTRRSGQDDVVVGVPVAGRRLKEAEPMIGYFINTVALRTRKHGNPAFGDWVRQVRDAVLEAQDHQDLPFEKLIEALHPDRGARHHPVFQVLFNLIGFEQEGLVLPGLESTPEPVPPTHPKFDLTLYVILRPGVFALKARYASDQFGESWVTRLLAQFEALLTAVTGNPDLLIGQPSLVLPCDAAALPMPQSPLVAAVQPAIHAAFDVQARRHPDRLA
ncbi:MAG: AMP-binding protein, partial [Verrucomicrobia bacterium]|nr:AMP-binding protein [Verrucomicrobiota bacterium]